MINIIYYCSDLTGNSNQQSDGNVTLTATGPESGIKKDSSYVHFLLELTGSLGMGIRKTVLDAEKVRLYNFHSYYFLFHIISFIIIFPTLPKIWKLFDNE